MDNFRDLYQQLILDHNQNPRNFREILDTDLFLDGHNPLCGDRIKVFIRKEDKRISDISFTGSGCAISKASASIMTTLLKGKTIDEAKKIFEDFHKMITTGEADLEKMGKLAVLAGVHQFPARVKCAALAWHTAMSILNDKKLDIVSTET
ncbi:MAG: SUF system NifU family Fe-S cluster assembly protein [FCB group bacterium]|nr:SUF system NifU family Fe-S cluster assembly protein [FCB group bacterium]